MISAGFDGCHLDEGSTQDGSAGLDLTPEDFAWITTEIVACTSHKERIPVISVLEGGYGKWKSTIGAYDREPLALCCKEHVKSLRRRN